MRFQYCLMCPSSHIFLYFRFDYQIGYDNTDAASSILLVVIELDKNKVQIITLVPGQDQCTILELNNSERYIFRHEHKSYILKC